MGDHVVSAVRPGIRSAGSTDLFPAALFPGFGRVFVVGAGYYLGCLAGFALRFPSSGIAYIWPASAILTSALLLLNPRQWPLIFAVTFATHGIAHGQDGIPATVWVWQFAGNAVQAGLAAALVRRFSERPLRYDTLRSVTVFIAGAAVAAPAIASVIPAYAYVKMEWASSFWTAWGMRTLTNLVSTVTLVPPLVALFAAGRRLLDGLTLPRIGEFLLLLLGLFAVDRAASALLAPTFGALPPAVFACMPFLAWAAARFGTPGLSICLLALTHLSIELPLRTGASEGAPLAQTIVGIQMFVGIAVSPLMFLSAALEESRQTRRTEEALSRVEAKNAAILRAIPDLMFVLTKDSDYRYVDYYCWDTSQFLVAPEQFLGKRVRDVLPPDLADSFEELFAHVIKSGEPRVLEYSVPMNGERRFYEARVVRCDDDRLLSIVRDITDRKRAEAGLHKAQHALARMNRASALGELAASIAHEVQQPLGAISTNAAVCQRWLEQDATNAGQLGEALADIVRDSKRASEVIRRTRDLFSSGERDNVPVELNAAIDEVLALTRNRVEQSGESVRRELGPGPLIVMGDRVQIQQVLVNLVLNGLHAMSDAHVPNGVLVVRSWREGGFVHVAVSDDGPGFDRSEIDHIFDPFYTTKSDGLGIGLAISRSILRAHGGTLEARLNPHGGATFEFTIREAREGADLKQRASAGVVHFKGPVAAHRIAERR